MNDETQTGIPLTLAQGAMRTNLVIDVQKNKPKQKQKQKHSHREPKSQQSNFHQIPKKIKNIFGNAEEININHFQNLLDKLSKQCSKRKNKPGDFLRRTTKALDKNISPKLRGLCNKFEKTKQEKNFI